MDGPDTVLDAPNRRFVPPSRRLAVLLAVIVLAGLVAGAFAYLLQANQNRRDADERFSALSKRVTQGIVERMRRYEYGLRGARGVVAAADGAITREAFARYAESRQIDREFPGARGFGIIFRVPAGEEAAFMKARRDADSAGFSIRGMAPHEGDRFVITYVEPAERNREAIGLDIASEAARRDAALTAARSSAATLTAPITLVQASGKRSGGLLLLLAIRRADGGPGAELIGWSYAPLLIEDILKGLDAEEEHFSLSLYDLDHSADTAFYSTRSATEADPHEDGQRLPIEVYGRRWEAELLPTAAFMQSLHQPSPLSEGIKALLLGGVFAALVATAAQLADRTRGQRLELARRAAIVEGSSDAIVVQTLDGAITDWNDGATRLFGFTRDEAKGRTATELLLPPELAAEDESLRATVASGGRVRVFETWRRARDGTSIPVSITASPIHDGSGNVVGSAKILRDVRESKAAEQRMRELNASLEDQVRERTALLDEAMRQAREANEAKSRFLANISHEIRTPMNAVLGLSHLLERTPLDAGQAAMLGRIRMAGKTLMGLLNDVLDFSKIEAGGMTLESVPFHLEDVIDEVTSLMGISAQQRGIAFAVTTQGAIPAPLLGDSTRLAQILLNLLSNAIKFTAKGRVELQVRVGAMDGAGLLPVSFCVTDTGIGIPLDVQQRLFQPFVQADASTTRKFGGTGLGLSIVRQLVQLLGGTIALQSRPGEGSSFQVDLRFPLAAQGSGLASLHRAASATAPALSGARLLVIDDNALNREVAERILLSEGAVVTLACDGQQALDLLTQAGAVFDAVLMDVQMPVMDGLTATRRLRELPQGAGLPVVGLTAGVSSDERRAALDAGMNAVVGKPFDPAVLAATLAAQLRRAPAPVAEPQPELAPDWPAVPGLDARLSWRNLKGDRALLRRMLGALQAMLEANGRMLADAQAQPDALAGHKALLHDLKAIAGTLGATGLQAAAAEAEQQCRGGDQDAALAAVRRVADAGASLARAAMPAEAAREVPAAEPLPQGGDGLLARLLGELRSNDLAAIATCQAHVGALQAQLGEALAAQLAEKVQALEFAAAERVLQARACGPSVTGAA